MVTRIPLLLFVSLAVLAAVACGGGGDSPPASTTRAPSGSAGATATPTGPRVVVEPHAGPPGIEITVRGSGWEPGSLIDLTGKLAPGTTAEPYETVTSAADGSFTARFRLETTVDGSKLDVGRYDLIARSPSTEVTVPFLVETRRPVGGTGPTG